MYGKPVDNINILPSFGMLHPQRNYNAQEYKWGFGGMLKDDDIRDNSGTSYDYGFRIYDPRVGRFLSTDPLASIYPNLSSYVFVANNPIIAIDPDGRGIKPINTEAEKMVKEAISSFGSDFEKAMAIRTTTDGVMRSRLADTKTAKVLTFKEFKKNFKGSIKKSQMKDAYNLYSTLASGNKYELAVFTGNKGEFVKAENVENGTKTVGDNGLTTNEAFKSFEDEFEKEPSQRTIIKEINQTEKHGDDWGLIEYIPEKNNDPDLSHKGTILIDATNSTPSQGANTLINALEQVKLK